MTISSQPAMSLLDSVLKADQARIEAGVAVLDKAQEITRQQGEAMVHLLEESGSRLDVYA